MVKLLATWQKSKDFWFVVFTCFGFFLLRLPSLFEPYWYGDEGIYEVIGLGLRQGRMLYAGIWDNKPPLLYLVYALFSGDQAGAKFLSLLVGIGAIIVFFFLAKKLFSDRRVIWTTTIIFSFLLGTPLLEGNIANAENFMVLPILISALYLVHAVEKHKSQTQYKKYLPFIISGLLLGFAFLFKVVAIFDLGAFGFFIFAMLCEHRKSLFPTLAKLIVLGVSFVIPLALTTLYFAAHGLLKVFLQSAFSSNVSYVNYGNQLIVPQGLLILKLILLSGVCLFLLIKRKHFSTTYLFIMIWLAFSLFNALFSQRPYTHYLLVMIGSISLLVGLIMTITNLKLQKIYIVGLLVLLLFINMNFWIYNKSLKYYENFASFLIGTKSATDYRAFFDNAANRDYDIKTFLTEHLKPGENIFVWGNDGQIYKLTDTLPPGRYIVAYWMAATAASRQETAQALAKSSPKFIVILPNQPALPFSLSNYSEIVLFDGAVIYERAY